MSILDTIPLISMPQASIIILEVLERDLQKIRGGLSTRYAWMVCHPLCAQSPVPASLNPKP